MNKFLIQDKTDMRSN